MLRYLFYVFWIGLCATEPCEKHRFLMVFTVWEAHRPFRTYENIGNFRHFSGYFFQEGCRQRFFINFGSMLVLLSTIWEKGVKQKHQTNHWKKVTQGSAGVHPRRGDCPTMSSGHPHPGGHVDYLVTTHRVSLRRGTVAYCIVLHCLVV